MRPAKRSNRGEAQRLGPRLEEIVDPNHPLVKLAQRIDWAFIEQHLDAVYRDGPGQPPRPTRLMAGMAILKHMRNLSDEKLCESWLENPYYQLFCGEEFFRYSLPLDRSSMTRWRQRMGEEKLTVLLQESLHLATRTGAARPADFTRVIVDTTVQPKAVAFPTDARLLHRTREWLVKLARKHGVRLRQSYKRVGKSALIRHQRHAHAKQFKRASRALRTLRTYLGRVMRDIGRKITGDASLRARFAQPLALARRVHEQRYRQRGPKVYSLHAPEVECIAKAKAHRPYEFGVKVSLTTPLRRCRGGQFVAHVAALPGNPYDGHTLATVLPAITRQNGTSLIRVITDDGYRGHNAPPGQASCVYTSGQKRGVTAQIKRELGRRPAVEPVIGHLKEDHRMGRNYLAGRIGDVANAVLAAVGYNFRLLLVWLAGLWWLLRMLVGSAGTVAPNARYAT
jgi:transposase, IS5 family